MNKNELRAELAKLQAEYDMMQEDMEMWEFTRAMYLVKTMSNIRRSLSE